MSSALTQKVASGFSELQQAALDLFAEGHTIREVCEDLCITVHTVATWRKEPAFATSYGQARATSFDVDADDVRSLADNVSGDKGAIDKARLQIDARKWRLSKLAPHIYGDKVQLDINGHIDVAGTLAEARARLLPLRPLRDRSDIIDGEITDESATCDGEPRDNVSPAALTAPDGLQSNVNKNK